jgi:transposase
MAVRRFLISPAHWPRLGSIGLAQWYRTRTEGAPSTRKTMIVALARKLLVALWRLVTTGELPAGVLRRSGVSS